MLNGWTDAAISAVDVLLVAFILYRVLLVIKDTRAFQMLIGLLMITLAYVVSPFLHLYTLNWILNKFLSPFILIIIILFQDDIRRGLTRVGKSPFLGGGVRQAEEAESLEVLARCCVALAAKRIGALIVFERDVRISEHVESGTTLDARVSAELIASVFAPTSPIHDGAVVVSRDRIVAAGVILPLSHNQDIAKSLGTRHRAALGITELTDALALVVSEEEGSISLVSAGVIRRDLDAASLHQALAEAI